MPIPSSCRPRSATSCGVASGDMNVAKTPIFMVLSLARRRRRSDGPGRALDRPPQALLALGAGLLGHVLGVAVQRDDALVRVGRIALAAVAVEPVHGEAPVLAA